MNRPRDDCDGLASHVDISSLRGITSHCMPAAWAMLLEAFECAHEVQRSKWDFAVEIANLRHQGLNESHFRWLVCKGFVEHANETTLLGQTHRSFRSLGGLTFAETTCFAITPAGVAFARELFRGSSAPGAHQRQVPGCREPREDAGESNAPTASRLLAVGNGHGSALPKWDSDRHELSLDGTLVKRFKHRSPNQETILMSFEEEHWRPRVDDPLPPLPEIDSKRRLNDTIKSLNNHQIHRLIHFRGDGTGEAIVWEPVGRE